MLLQFTPQQRKFFKIFVAIFTRFLRNNHLIYSISRYLCAVGIVVGASRLIGKHCTPAQAFAPRYNEPILNVRVLTKLPPVAILEYFITLCSFSTKKQENILKLY